MIQKKICMLGSFAVGKTSLVARYVHSVFSDKYLTTIGVKIDRKELTIEDDAVSLMLWDIHGEDEFQRVRASYLRGMAGYFLVVDPTRPETLQTAIRLNDLAVSVVGDRPKLMLFNKFDIHDRWLIEPAAIDKLKEQGWEIRNTSAKETLNVEESFHELTMRILNQDVSGSP